MHIIYHTTIICSIIYIIQRHTYTSSTYSLAYFHIQFSEFAANLYTIYTRRSHDFASRFCRLFVFASFVVGVLGWSVQTSKFTTSCLPQSPHASYSYVIVWMFATRKYVNMCVIIEAERRHEQKQAYSPIIIWGSQALYIYNECMTLIVYVCGSSYCLLKIRAMFGVAWCVFSRVKSSESRSRTISFGFKTSIYCRGIFFGKCFAVMKGNI